MRIVTNGSAGVTRQFLKTDVAFAGYVVADVAVQQSCIAVAFRHGISKLRFRRPVHPRLERIASIIMWT